MSKLHYHVMAGIHGCLPDYNEKCDTMISAKLILRDHIMMLKETEKFSGNLRHAWYESIEGNYYAGVESCIEPECTSGDWDY